MERYRRKILKDSPAKYPILGNVTDIQISEEILRYKRKSRAGLPTATVVLQHLIAGQVLCDARKANHFFSEEQEADFRHLLYNIFVIISETNFLPEITPKLKLLFGKWFDKFCGEQGHEELMSRIFYARMHFYHETDNDKGLYQDDKVKILKEGIRRYPYTEQFNVYMFNLVFRVDAQEGLFYAEEGLTKLK